MKPVSRKGSGPLASRGPGDITGKLFSFMTNIALVAVWKVLWALSLPIGRLIALNLWLGRSLLTLSIHFEHQVLKAIGWLSSPALPPHAKLARTYKKNMGADMKNWHVGLGKSRLCSQLPTWHPRASLALPLPTCLGHA